MDTTPDPHSSGLHRYQPGRYPYVEVTIPGEFPFHAQVRAWRGDQIMIGVPTDIRGRFNIGQTETRWVDKRFARRIRTADSRWITGSDDHAWHASQDATVKYRPNPFTITQHDSDNPGAGGAD